MVLSHKLFDISSYRTPWKSHRFFFFSEKKLMFLCPISSLQRHLYIVSSENLHGTNSWTQFFHLCFQAFLYSQYLIPRQSFSPPWGYNKWFGWFYPAAFFSILPGRTAGFYTHNHQTDIYIKVMSLQSSLDGAFGCNLPNMMELADK